MYLAIVIDMTSFDLFVFLESDIESYEESLWEWKRTLDDKKFVLMLV